MKLSPHFLKGLFLMCVFQNTLFFITKDAFSCAQSPTLAEKKITENFSAASEALKNYVKQPDPSYSWKIEKTLDTKDYRAFIVKLNALTWRSSEEVSTPLWQHWLTIVKPKTIRTDKALLSIGNGNDQEALPESPHSKWIKLALETHSVVAEIRNVPYQPLIYFNDGIKRYEDNSVAYSWDKAMTTHDLTWSIRFPMVKSVVRAMDTIQALLKTDAAIPFQVNGFVLTGESKRGWATWLTSAIDQRIIALIPMVIDCLNIEKFLNHHYCAYGFWAPTLKDYIHHHIIDRYETTEFKNLMQAEDPYFYKDKITAPKYIIAATGDQFFLPDGSQFYFNDLVGPKYLRYLPNTGHMLQGSDAFQSLQSFYALILQGAPLPQFSWIKKEDGALEVTAQDIPDHVALWSAHNPTARDFRLETIGKNFTKQPLKKQKEGTYLALPQTPEKGFRAFFIELTYSKKNALPFKVTTEVSVVPNILPFTFKKEPLIKEKEK